MCKFDNTYTLHVYLQATRAVIEYYISCHQTVNSGIFAVKMKIILKL